MESQEKQPLVDFFTIVGIDKQKGLELFKYEAQKIEDHINPLRRPFHPHLLVCFPPSRPKSAVTCRNIELLCFPQGIKFQKQEDNRRMTFHSFVLTQETGTRIYGANLIFFEQVHDQDILEAAQLECTFQRSPKRINNDSLQTKASSRVFQSSKHKLFAPKAICILSRFPAVACFEQYLRQLYLLSQLCKPSEELIATSLQHLLLHTPLPPPGCTLKFQCLHPIVCHNPQTHALPLMEYSMRRLFSLLSPENIIHLVTCLLLEKQVIIRSQDYELLVLVAECATGLMYPFMWQHTYVPILPMNALHILEAPFPYIMGVHSELSVPLADDATCFVDLSQSTVTSPEDIPRFPDADKLASKLHKLVKMSGSSSGCANLLAGGGAKVLHRLLSGKSMPKVPNNPGTFEDHAFTAAVRHTFVSLWADVLKGYSTYVLAPEHFEVHTNGCHNDDSIFDKIAFLSDQPSERDAFLTAFVETQAFASFLDEKYAVTCAVKDPDAKTCFDQIIDAKMNDYDVDIPSTLDTASPLSVREHVSDFSNFASIVFVFMLDRLSFTNDDEITHLLHNPLARTSSSSIPIDFEAPSPFDIRTVIKFAETSYNLSAKPHTLDEQMKTREHQSVDKIGSRRVLPEVPSHVPIINEPKLPKCEDIICGKNHFKVPMIPKTFWQQGQTTWPSESYKSGAQTRLQSRTTRRSRTLEHRSASTNIAQARLIAARSQGLRHALPDVKLDDLAPAESQEKFANALVTECAEKVKKMIRASFALQGQHAPQVQSRENTMVAGIHDLLERAFRHGFLRKHKSPLWAFLLACLKTGTLPSEVQATIREVAQMSFLRSDTGRSRAFVRLLLEQKRLSEYLEIIFKCAPAITDVYKPYAFLNHSDLRMQLASHLLSLNTLELHCFTTSYKTATITYRVLIFTAKNFRAGTTSNVSMKIVGDFDTTATFEFGRSPSFNTSAVYEQTFSHSNLGVLSTTNGTTTFTAESRFERLPDSPIYALSLAADSHSCFTRDEKEKPEYHSEVYLKDFPTVENEIMNILCEELATAINRIVKFAHQQQSEQDWTVEQASLHECLHLQLLLGPMRVVSSATNLKAIASVISTDEHVSQKSICEVLEDILCHGLKQPTLFPSTRTAWDVIEACRKQIEQGSLLCDPETLFHKACTVAHDEKLPKPAKFERFVAFGAENHVLHVWFDMPHALSRQRSRMRQVCELLRHLVYIKLNLTDRLSYFEVDKAKAKWLVSMTRQSDPTMNE
eukprot:gene1889-4983_t